jgi:sporulation protein YlmC with PRC-barrel domain
MRNLLLLSGAILAVAAAPALADSLLSGGGAKVGADIGTHVGATAAVGSDAADAAGDAGVQADTRTTVDTGTAAAANPPSGAPADGAAPGAAATAIDAGADLQNNAQGSFPTVFAVSQLMGKTVIDVNGQTVGEVRNAVLTTDAHAVTKIVIASGGFLGIGTREVAVDAASVDGSGASEGTVRLRDLTEADLDAMAEFEADGSAHLLNPS